MTAYRSFGVDFVPDATMVFLRRHLPRRPLREDEKEEEETSDLREVSDRIDGKRAQRVHDKEIMVYWVARRWRKNNTTTTTERERVCVCVRSALDFFLKIFSNFSTLSRFLSLSLCARLRLAQGSAEQYVDPFASLKSRCKEFIGIMKFSSHHRQTRSAKRGRKRKALILRERFVVALCLCFFQKSSFRIARARVELAQILVLITVQENSENK